MELDDSRVTEYKNLEKKFNVPDGHHIENRFDHNSAGKCDCAISVKFCEGMQFFLQNLRTGTDTRVPQNVYLVFLMQFGLRRAAVFSIVSDTFVIFILMG